MTEAKGQNLTKQTLTSRSYVQDGLITMFDGIENSGYGVHKGHLAQWCDLKGMFNIPIPESCQVTDNSIIFPYGGAKSSVQLPSLFHDFPDHDFTIGCLLKLRAQPKSKLDHLDITGSKYNEGTYNSPRAIEIASILRSYDNRSCIQWWPECNTMTLSRDYYATSGIDDDCTKLASVEIKYTYDDHRYGNAYINSVYTTHAAPYMDTRCHWETLTFPSMQQQDNAAEIKRIWIYDRALTPEEQVFNYRIDKVRFGI